MAATHFTDGRRRWKVRPRHPGIYAIRHIASGRAYVGSSRNIYLRWLEHKSDLEQNGHRCPYLQNAWNKYGSDAFAWEVLEISLPERSLLCAREQHWMDKHKGNLFNSQKTAEPTGEHFQTAEYREATRQRMLGNKLWLGRHNHGHLTDDCIRDILYCYAAGESRDSIAARHKTHVVNVSRIVSRKTWWHIEVPPEIDAACRERTKHRARGAANAHSKLADRIPEIRQRIASGESDSSIARDMNVTPAAIGAIRKGRTYCY